MQLLGRASTRSRQKKGDSPGSILKFSAKVLRKIAD
jgi:hypothetical protein